MKDYFAGLGISMQPILLPSDNIDLEKWAVVACDQYTSEPKYWEEIETIVGNAPSTLHITFPEAYLSSGDNRIESINANMRGYLSSGVLEKSVDGLVLVERTTQSGRRLGLVMAIDLEQYDFNVGSKSLIRATEGTILDRLPPRVKIRKNACLESPHIMLLADDPLRTLIDPLYQKKDTFKKLYDFELMANGGHIKGWHVDDDTLLTSAAESVKALYNACNGFLFAVGDGNHSLATARACWLMLKDTLSNEEQLTHPARFALVELVNLHDDALIFEPIHRVIFGADGNKLLSNFESYLKDMGMELAYEKPSQKHHLITFVVGEIKKALYVINPTQTLEVDTLQRFLDAWLKNHAESTIDYIHGEETLMKLTANDGACGFLLPAMDKHLLFPAVALGGSLPRKTFSMGEANEKRYYMECRKIIK